MYKLLLRLALPCLCGWSFFAHATEEESTYCRDMGGRVESMSVHFETSHGPVTGWTKEFCTFTPDNGFLTIGLETFASIQPNLAATYMKTLPPLEENSALWQGKKGVNPSYNVCHNLGGVEINAVMQGSFANNLGDSDICVFGDGSMVSGWSLIYMANHRTGYDDVKNKVRSEPL